MVTEGEYDVFISHASEDKEDFVEPLVHKLIELGIRPWYDDMSLDLGDSLRKNIDTGLAASEYGVVVLSPSFFAKRWPERELNGLVQKALGEDRKVILPVWYKVSYEDVAAYSLPLADLVAARYDEGVDVVADRIARVIRGKGGVADAENLERSHDLSGQKLLASAKKMIADPTQVVGIHELGDALARDAFTELDSKYKDATMSIDDLNVANLWDEYRKILHSSATFCALASNLGHSAHYPSILRVVSILTRDPGQKGGSELNQGIWQYSSSYIIYGTGLAAIQRKRMDLTVQLLSEITQTELKYGGPLQLVEYVEWGSINEFAKNIFRPNDTQFYRTPLSAHFAQEMKDVIGTYFIDDKEFSSVFDIFEFTLGLVHSLRSLRAGHSIGWIPPGGYLWKNAGDESTIPRLKDEAEHLGAVELIFNGNAEWFKESVEHSIEWSSKFGW